MKRGWGDYQTNKRKFSIPVLTYHHVSPEGDFINVKPQIFEAQMRYLSEHGFTTLHTDEFMSILSGKKIPPKKSLMITFDDGWLDNWLVAFPILKKYGIKAVIFVITSLIAEKGRRHRVDEGTSVRLPDHKECQKMIQEGHASEVMLSWEEITEMLKSGLIEIQSHTHTHKRWDKLYKDTAKQIDNLNRELKTSKKVIEEKLDSRCNALCWPQGKYIKDYVDLAMSLGYELLFTTEKGANTQGTEPWKIRRIVIGNISLLTFRKKLFIHSRSWISKAYLRVFK
ncbi:MAG: hypothetical protein A2Y97_10300 [Nitrospirae bacterium RBG_13_39_12]|nr:MAG: hypothetical protein A2Y97_10300 [Nitrospirae bacterium RBG_13_39_12]